MQVSEDDVVELLALRILQSQATGRSAEKDLKILGQTIRLAKIRSPEVD